VGRIQQLSGDSLSILNYDSSARSIIQIGGQSSLVIGLEEGLKKTLEGGIQSFVRRWYREISGTAGLPVGDKY